MYMYHVHTWYLWKSEEGIGSSGIGIMDVCESPCEYWKLNPGTLPEQKVFLTTESSLGPLTVVLCFPGG